jgi:type II secretory pathway component GspD/PulD (secretin)
MLKYFGVAVLMTGVCVLGGQALAQTEPAAKAKRTVYVVRHGAAKELATLLERHFKGDADVQVLPDAPSNCLLISAPPADFDEVVKLLDQLDRRPHAVAVEVLIAEAPSRKAEGDKSADQGLDERDFTGPVGQVLEKVEALHRKGQIQSLKRIQLTALENRPAQVLVGDNKPFVMSSTTTATGHVARMITYHQLGSEVRLTPRLTSEGQVQLDLTVQEAGAAYPDDGPQVGEDENSKPVRAPEFTTARLETKLDVPAGLAVAANAVQKGGKAGRGQTLVIVTARVEGADAEPKK